MGPQDASKLANHALVVAQHQPSRDLVRGGALCCNILAVSDELLRFLLGKHWVSAPVFAQMGQVSGEVARNLFFQTAQVSKKVAGNFRSGQSAL